MPFMLAVEKNIKILCNQNNSLNIRNIIMQQINHSSDANQLYLHIWVY